MDVYEEAAQKIIHEQENIIGPLAVEQAKRVQGLEVDADGKTIRFSGNKADALDRLVKQYRQIFGQTSVEVCKDAVRPLLSKLEPAGVPAMLK